MEFSLKFILRGSCVFEKIVQRLCRALFEVEGHVRHKPLILIRLPQEKFFLILLGLVKTKLDQRLLRNGNDSAARHGFRGPDMSFVLHGELLSLSDTLTRLRSTFRVPSLKLMSRQRKARISPRRRPVVTANRSAAYRLSC